VRFIPANHQPLHTPVSWVVRVEETTVLVAYLTTTPGHGPAKVTLPSFCTLALTEANVGVEPLDFAKVITAAEAKAAPAFWTTAVCALVLRFWNFGKATAERMPRITITVTSSIRVKPFCDLITSFSD
jgi:hypothetical protein